MDWPDSGATTLPHREPAAPGGAGPAVVTVVGVGGAGVNCISRLLDVGIPGVRCLAIDTSAQTLTRVPEANRLLLTDVTRGLGTGGSARLGAAAVWAAERPVQASLRGAEVVLVVAGLGGGTGGGAGPEVVRLARAAGALVIGCGIRPFPFEAGTRRRAAREAAAALAGASDTAFMVDNAQALDLAGNGVDLDLALRVADDRIRQAVQGLGALLAGRGWIQVDMAHVRNLLGAGGTACLALGVARGDWPAEAAMTAMLAHPMTDQSALARAHTVLVHVAGGWDLAVADTAAALAVLRPHLADDCQIVVGAGLDAALSGAAQVVVLATAAAERAPAIIAWPDAWVRPEPATPWREVV
jgi:cell division protein FtsZ